MPYMNGIPIAEFMIENAKKIREARHERRWSREELAARAEISVTMLEVLELADTRTAPAILAFVEPQVQNELLKKIARAFDEERMRHEHHKTPSTTIPH